MAIEIAKLYATFGADTKAFEAGARKVDEGIGSTQGKLQGLAGSFESVGSALTSRFTLPLALIGGFALKAAADYESALAVMQAVSGATAEQMGRVGQRAKELGADLTLPNTSAGDAAKAMTELAKSGLSVEQSMIAAKGALQLAAAGAIGNAEAAGIMGKALNAFRLDGNQAVRVADLLAAAANNSASEVKELAYGLQAGAAVFAAAKVPIEDFITSLTLLSNAGIQGSDAGTSLKSMLMALQAPSGVAADLMKALGLSIYTAQGTLKPLTQIISEFGAVLGEQGRTTLPGSIEQFEKMGKAAKTAEKELEGLREKSTSLGRALAEGLKPAEFAQRRYEFAVKDAQKTVDEALAKHGSQSDAYRKAVLALEELNHSHAVHKQRQIEQRAELDKTNTAIRDRQKIVDDYKKLTDGTTKATRLLTDAEKDHYKATLVGSDGIRALNVLLAAGGAGFERQREANQKAGAAAELAAAKMKGLTGSLKGLYSQVETLALVFAEPFLKPLAGIVDALSGFVERLAGLNPELVRAGVAFGVVLAAAGPLLFLIGGIGSALGVLLTPVGLVTLAVAGLAALLVTRFKPILADLGAIAKTAIGGDLTGAWQLFLSRLPAWQEQLSTFARVAWQWLHEAAATAKLKLGEWWLAVSTYLSEQYPNWLKQVSTWGTTLATFASGAWEQTKVVLGEWWGALLKWGGDPQRLTDIRTALLKLDWASAWLEAVNVDWAKAIGERLGAGIGSLATILEGALKSMQPIDPMGAIADAPVTEGDIISGQLQRFVRSLGNAFIKIGGQLAEGFWKGFVESVGAEKLQGWLRAIHESIEKFIDAMSLALKLSTGLDLMGIQKATDNIRWLVGTLDRLTEGGGLGGVRTNPDGTRSSVPGGIGPPVPSDLNGAPVPPPARQGFSGPPAPPRSQPYAPGTVRANSVTVYTGMMVGSTWEAFTAADSVKRLPSEQSVAGSFRR